MNSLRWPKFFHGVPNWQIFAKSGHTAAKTNRPKTNLDKFVTLLS